MTYTYYPVGTCSNQINVEIDDETEKIANVQFIGGCNGNQKGIAALVKGQSLDDVIDRLSGIKCGMKGTSCPDQLAKALIEIKEEY